MVNFISFYAFICHSFCSMFCFFVFLEVLAVFYFITSVLLGIFVVFSINTAVWLEVIIVLMEVSLVLLVIFLVLMHNTTVLLFNTVVLHFNSDVLHFNTDVLHFNTTLLHFNTVVLHFNTVTLTIIIDVLHEINAWWVENIAMWRVKIVDILFRRETNWFYSRCFMQQDMSLQVISSSK